MAVSYKLREIISALDPIAEWQPKSVRELNKRLRWEGGWQGVGPLSCRSLMRTEAGNSLRNAFHNTDSANPPKTLRQAYERLAFPLGGGVSHLPDGPISLRRIAKRIKGPDHVQLRYLSYNTYLLPGLQIPFGRWIDDTVGWDALSWFGIPLGGALLVSLGLASVPGVAIATILEIAGFTPSTVTKAVTGIDLNTFASFNAKPGLRDRARILGPTLGIYDVCCVCEVFTEETRNEILSRLEQTSGGAPFAFTAGPDETGSWTIASSGLLFLARKKYPIVKTERLIFENRGSRRKDTDVWANKGVLMNVIDLGFGQLELFQTHLYYGNDLPDIPMLSKPSYDERLSVFRDELKELADFYRRHHRPQNVAVITGDFNLSGGNVREYGLIRHTMDGLNLSDLWSWDVYAHNPSEGNTCRFTDGDMSEWQREFEESVTPKGANVCKRLKQPDRVAQWQDYCDDRIFHPPPHSGVGRYDYIFVDRPTAEHRYTLDVSRILRRPFPLINLVFEEEKYLSDHLGLELMFYCTPR